MSTYFSMNAWREILARIFDGFAAQDNVSPEWLVNPATRRRLKLDRYYPDAGVAIRFVGLKAKGQGRQSDWEALETEQRDQTRTELCRLNGVQLALVDPNDEPVKQLDALMLALTRAKRILTDGKRPTREQTRRMDAISAANARASELRRLINKQPAQMMANLAESWRDREAGLAAPTSAQANGRARPKAAKASRPISLTPGVRVLHSHFGEGVVTAINEDNGDATVGIRFDGAGEKTFLASLLSGKIELA